MVYSCIENEHPESTRGIEVELIHIVKIIEVFETYLYISVGVCPTLSFFSSESFLTSHEDGRNGSNKVGFNGVTPYCVTMELINYAC